MEVYLISYESDVIGETYVSDLYLTLEGVKCAFEKQLSKDIIEVKEKDPDNMLSEANNWMGESFDTFKEYKEFAIDDWGYGFTGKYDATIFVKIVHLFIKDSISNIFELLISKNKDIFNSKELKQIEILQNKLIAKEVGEKV